MGSRAESEGRSNELEDVCRADAALGVSLARVVLLSYLRGSTHARQTAEEGCNLEGISRVSLHGQRLQISARSPLGWRVLLPLEAARAVVSVLMLKAGGEVEGARGGEWDDG